MAFPAPGPYRKHWGFAPGMVFLNHGAFGACPKPILALQNKLRLEMEAEPIQFLWRRYEERLEPSRRAVAKFVGAPPGDVAFVTNTTTGINAVVRSLKFKRGDEILTTNRDYNASRNVLVEAVQRAGARLVVANVPFPLKSEEDVVEAVLAAATHRTRLALIDQVTSDTGLVFPLAQIIRGLETKGIDVMVDGAHAPGMVRLNLAKLRPAYYAGNLHKWVCAPKGTAFLYVRNDRQETVQPAVISHGNNRPRPGFTPYQDRFDWPGTFDPTGWFCAGEALRWLEELIPGGWSEIRRRNHALVVQARRLLCDRLEVEPPCPESMLGSLATIPLPGRFQSRPKAGRIEAEQERLYDEFGIEVPFNRFGDPAVRHFRISAHLHNSLSQYEYLAEALGRL